MARAVAKRDITRNDSVRDFERINALQITIAFAAVAFLYSTIPDSRPLTGKFFELQHCGSPPWYSFLSKKGHRGLCGKGPEDLYIVITGILVFTMLRAFMMSYVYIPIGRAQGIRKSKALMRFAEQAWGLTFALSSWTSGMYFFYYSSYWLKLDAFYANYPETRLDPIFKLYYLMQIAFWLQCILALNLEAKRKDYLQMFGHHILTSVLLIGSYTYHTTRVGNVILILMDSADIFLPSAKMLKYTGHQTLCDGTFVLFLLTWAFTRHYLLVKVILGAHRAQAVVEGSGRNITWIFVALLSGLEVLICIWSYAILRVLWGIVRGGNADDSRSDSESTEPDSLQPHLASAQNIEVSDVKDSVSDDFRKSSKGLDKKKNR